jgi:hypothetical protein
LLGRCSRQLRKSRAGANTAYQQAESVFILENVFASKSFATVCEAFSNAYPDKEVPNKTRIHRLVTTFRWMLVFGKWWMFSASAVKVFFKFFLTNKNKKMSFVSLC